MRERKKRTKKNRLDQELMIYYFGFFFFHTQVLAYVLVKRVFSFIYIDFLDL